MVDLQGERKGINLVIYALVVIVSLNLINCGYIQGWPMPALPMLLSSNSPIELNSDEAGWVASILFPGVFIGGVTTGLKIDKYGARRIVIASAIPSLIGWTILGLATTYWELLLGRFILGITFGLSGSCWFYLSELTEARVRGYMCSLCCVAVNVGLVSTFGLGPYFSLHVMAWLSMILPAVFLLLMIWAPESPYWLSKTKKYKEMKKTLVRLRQTENVQVEFDSINSFVDEQCSSDNHTFSWRSLRTSFSRRANRRGSFFAILVSMAQQLSGIQAINSYAQLIFKRTNYVLDERYVALFLGVTELCCTILSTFIVDKVGRKPLFVISAIGSASSMLILGIHFHLDSIGIDLKSVQLLPICIVLLFAVSYGLGLSPMSTIINAECIPLEVRTVAIPILAVICCLLATAITKLWQVVTDSFGVLYAFGGVALITYINAVIVLIFMPETKGKTLAEIQEILEGRQDRKTKYNNICSLEETNSHKEDSTMFQNSE